MGWGAQNLVISSQILKTFKCGGGGAWVAESIKHMTLDFGSGCDLTSGSAQRRVCFGLSLPLSLCPSPPNPACALSQRNKILKKKSPPTMTIVSLQQKLATLVISSTHHRPHCLVVRKTRY